MSRDLPPRGETAKSEAHCDLVEEESGRSAPKRIFARLFGGGGEKVAIQSREENKARESESP